MPLPYSYQYPRILIFRWWPIWLLDPHPYPSGVRRAPTFRFFSSNGIRLLLQLGFRSDMEGTVMLNSVFAIIIELRSISNVRGLMVFFKAFILVTLGLLYTCQNYFVLFVMPFLSRIGELCSVKGHTCPKKNKLHPV